MEGGEIGVRESSKEALELSQLRGNTKVEMRRGPQASTFREKNCRVRAGFDMRESEGTVTESA